MRPLRRGGCPRCGCNPETLLVRQTPRRRGTTEKVCLAPVQNRSSLCGLAAWPEIFFCLCDLSGLRIAGTYKLVLDSRDQYLLDPWFRFF